MAGAAFFIAIAVTAIVIVVLVLRKRTQTQKRYNNYTGKLWWPYIIAIFPLYRDAGNEVYIQATTNAAYELSKFQEETTY